MRSINDWVAECHRNSREHGFWDGDDVNDNNCVAAKLALIHSEVSEALEALRNGYMGIHHEISGKPDGFPIEIADVVIRCFDLAGAMGFNLEEAIELKHAYNRSREYRHGRKL